MSLKIKLQKNKNGPSISYKLVVVNQKSTPKSMYLDKIGTYDVHRKELILNKLKYEKWIANGVVPTTSIKKLLLRFQI